MSLSLIFAFLHPIEASANQVTSGLLVDLNISNPSSYSGSGTTVNDMAGTNNSATLVNGPTYESAGGPGIVTDGVNDYLEILNTVELQPGIGTATTVQLWARVNTSISGKGLLSKQFGSSGGFDGYTLGVNGNNSLVLNMNGATLNDSYVSVNNVFTTNTWTLFTAIIRFGGGSANQSKVFVNSTEVLSAPNTESGISQTSASIRLASNLQGYNEFSALKIGAFAFYNRALSVSEITSNYNYYFNYAPDSTPPAITTNSALSAAENQTLITTLAASETSTWSLRPSFDSATVNLNSSNGALSFKSAPNFEAPIDANGDNNYQVTVRATDAAGNFSELALTISVTDVDETSTISLTLSAPAQKGITISITATASTVGRIRFFVGGKRIPGCINRIASGSPIQVSCNWKPAVSGAVLVSAQLTPTDLTRSVSNSVLRTTIGRRSNLR